MFTAALKLADIAARSLFALLALFLLPAAQAGQFGLVLTLAALFSFAVGYERYVDFQRRLVVLPSCAADGLLRSTCLLSLLHAVVASPLLVLLLSRVAELGPLLTAAAVVIAVGDHAGNEAYRVSLALPRYRALLACSVGRNLAVLAGVVLLWWDGRTGSLDNVLLLWATASTGALLLQAVVVWRVFERDAGPPTPLRAQWAGSWTHFRIGLASVLSLQADRLIAGGLLGLDAAGSYYRHVLLASIVYQVFNVASFNRIKPAVYVRLAAQNLAGARAMLRRERLRVAPLALLALAGAWLLPTLGGALSPKVALLIPAYLTAAMVAVGLRVWADYNCLLLNGAYRERDVYRAQWLSVVVATAASVLAAATFGIGGLLAAMVLGSAVYAALSTVYCRRLHASGLLSSPP